MSTDAIQTHTMDPSPETAGEAAASATEPAFETAIAEPVKPALEPEFDWFNDDSVVMREQLQVAVYRNRVNAIVIRQEGSGYEPEDQFVILRDAEAVRTLIAVLQRELRGGG